MEIFWKIFLCRLMRFKKKILLFLATSFGRVFKPDVLGFHKWVPHENSVRKINVFFSLSLSLSPLCRLLRSLAHFFLFHHQTTTIERATNAMADDSGPDDDGEEHMQQRAIAVIGFGKRWKWKKKQPTEGEQKRWSAFVLQCGFLLILMGGGWMAGW